MSGDKPVKSSIEAYYVEYLDNSSGYITSIDKDFPIFLVSSVLAIGQAFPMFASYQSGMIASGAILASVASFKYLSTTKAAQSIDASGIKFLKQYGTDQEMDAYQDQSLKINKIADTITSRFKKFAIIGVAVGIAGVGVENILLNNASSILEILPPFVTASISIYLASATAFITKKKKDDGDLENEFLKSSTTVEKVASKRSSLIKNIVTNYDAEVRESKSKKPIKKSF